MIVADSSALLEFLLGSPRGRAAERHLMSDEHPVQVPTLIDAEVIQGLRRLVARGVMTEERGRACLALLREMPINRHPITALLPRVWVLLDEDLHVSEAAYVALAEALDCPLLTFDEGLAASSGHEAWILMPAAGEERQGGEKPD